MKVLILGQTGIDKRSCIEKLALYCLSEASLPRNPAEKLCCDEMRRRLTSGLGQV